MGYGKRRRSRCRPGKTVFLNGSIGGALIFFLVAPLGRLTNFSLVWEMANKKLMSKPIILLGRRLRSLVNVLKKDPALEILSNFYLVPTIPQAIKRLSVDGDL